MSCALIIITTPTDNITVRSDNNAFRFDNNTIRFDNNAFRFEIKTATNIDLDEHKYSNYSKYVKIKKIHTSLRMQLSLSVVYYYFFI